VDIAKFTELASNTFLPFIYCGERLNNEKCQKLQRKLITEGSVLGVILEDGFGSNGLIITDKGIWFSISKKGYLFDNFIIHKVSLKKTLLGNYDIEFVFWDKNKNKSFEFELELNENYDDVDKTACKELAAIFESLVSKTGTEYIDPKEKKSIDTNAVFNSDDDPNTFDFVWGNLWINIHTIITLNDDSIIIKKFKFDDKTKIQTSQGEPKIISRSAIESITKGRGFSPLSILGGIVIGIVVGFVGFVGFGGIFTVLIFTIISMLLAFPKLLVIKRKD
jgi:hypothetical protein